MGTKRLVQLLCWLLGKHLNLVWFICMGELPVKETVGKAQEDLVKETVSLHEKSRF
jgi:hypothetical protein